MKKVNIKKLFGGIKIPICFAAICALLLSQNVVNARETYTTVETQDLTILAETLLGPGVIIAASAPEAGTTHGNQAQIGLFASLISDVVPFTDGVILSTGNIAGGASITNLTINFDDGNEGSTFSTVPTYDVDLANFFSIPTNSPVGLGDAASIVLHVVPSNTTINIPFMFASEEYFLGATTYDAPTMEDYALASDRFAFFVKPGIVESSNTHVNFTNNIAKLATGQPVEIASVNQHTNVQYFVANVETNSPGEMVMPTGDIPIPMSYNGAAVGPTACIKGLVPGQVYTVKLVVADHWDKEYDSSVFLKEHGITSGADLALDVSANDSVVGLGAASGYTVTVRNVGPVTADDVVVTNRFPNGVTHVFPGDVVASRGTINPLGGGEYEWILGSLTNDTSATLTLAGVFGTAGVYTNSATVATSTGDYDSSNNADEATVVVSAGNPLVITVNPSSRMYGSADPAFSFADFSGDLLSGDTIADITGGTGSAADVDFSLVSTTSASPVGVYSNEVGIVLSSLDGSKASQYGISVVLGTLTITNAPLTITATTQSKPYGTTLSGGPLYTHFTVGAGQLQNGNTVDSVSVGYDDGDAATDPIGTYTNAINPSLAVGSIGFDAANYDITYVNGTLEVTAIALTITANDTNKVYGATVTFTGTEFTTSGLVNSDTVTSAEIASLGAAASAPVAGSPFAISITNGVGTGLGNYVISYVPGLLTITNAPLTITAAAQSKPYGTTLSGGPLYTHFTVGAGQLQNGNTVDSVTVGYDDGDATVDPIGTYTNAINPSLAVGSMGFDVANYDITYEDGTLEVTAIALTITANDTNKVYGATATFTGTEFTTSGLKNSDTVTSAEIASLGAVATATVAGSPYAISITNGVGVGLGNYTISYLPGLLTITNAPLTITATAQSKPYGTTLSGGPLYTHFTVGTGQLQNGNTVDSVTVGYDDGDAATDPIGTYTNAINPSLAVGSIGFDAANYDITYEDGTLEVTAIALTITANDTNKVYGATVTFTGTEFTTSGLKNSDTVTSAEIASLGAVATATVAGSPYAISITNAVGVGLGNYLISYVSGLLTVTNAPLTITATAQSKPYGTTLSGGPLYTYFTVGAGQLQNGNTVDSVTVGYGDGDAATDPIGTYTNAINPSLAVGSTGFDTANYDVTYEDGTLEVTAVTLTITANNTNKVYGATVTFAGTEFTTSGLKNSDTVTSAEIASLGAVATATVAGSPYAISITNGVGTGLGNYVISYVPGLLTVTNAPLTITANDTNKVYGATVTFSGTEFTPSGLKNSDTVTSAELASLGAAAIASVAGSPYVISITNAVGTGLENYWIVYSNGRLTVSPAALTITANDTNKVYGATVTFAGTEFSAVGLQGTDTVSSVTLTSAGAAAAASVIGSPYSIVPSAAVGAGIGNYSIVYSNGTLTVTKAPLTIEVNDASRGLSATQNPAFSFKNFTSQLKAGDTMAGITGGTGTSADVVFTLASTTFASPAGIYTNEIGMTTNSLDGARAANYVIVIDNGDLTILATSPNLNVTATWTLNRSTGLFEGTLVVVNNGDGEIPDTYDYWFAITNTVEYRLENPTGTLPDTRSYQNLTDRVRTALRGTGNQNAVWDPGERITLTGLVMYHLRRVNPSKYVDPNAAFEYGILFNGQDIDKNFRMDASELDAAASTWSQKAISTETLLEASRLGGGEAYQWNKNTHTWRVINKNEE